MKFIKTVSQLITILLFFTSGTLFASSADRLLEEIKTTFVYANEPILTSTYRKNQDGRMEHNGSKINSKYTPPLWDMKALDNVENNSSHQELKKIFERVLPYYLESDDLFSVEVLERFKHQKVELSEFTDFFSALYLYLGYLEHHPNEINSNMLHRLVDKSLKDAQALMQNSTKYLDYIIAISIYETMYERLSDSSIELKKIIVRYPPSHSSIFFEKLKKREQNEYNYIKNNPPHGMENREFFKQFLARYKEYTHMFYTHAIDAIKDGSDEAFQSYQEFEENEKKKSFTRWNALKFWISTYISKGIGFVYSENSYFGNMPEFSAMLLVTSFMNPSAQVLGELYQKHKALTEQYQTLVDDEDNATRK